jgi:hypothetical protein
LSIRILERCAKWLCENEAANVAELQKCLAESKKQQAAV